ncbi:MAG TPA: hypothetical protein VE991_08355, partial [Acidimicrobiales bacterium]|nr:hypothetical protein [Acidimicrobiales bacterium]
VALPDGAVRLAIGAGAVWATGTTDTLSRIAPKPVGVSLAWRTIRVGQGPIGVAVGSGSVWVANAVSGTVTRVDPARLRVTGTVPLGAGGVVGGNPTPAGAGGVGSASDPVTVAVFGGWVWVGNGQGGTLTAFDPMTGRQHGTPARLPGIPRRLVVSDDRLFATTANAGAVVAVTPR